MAYIDPNTSGIPSQALAAFLAALSGLALLFSRQIRADLAHARRFFRERLGGQVKEAPDLEPRLLTRVPGVGGHGPGQVGVAERSA